MKEKKYDRQKVVQYASRWATSRNPKYYNFDLVGGDCTSFASQAIYAGSGVMNYDKYGWYYRNGNDKSPSWSGVEYLYKFLVNNKSVGPYGREATIDEIEIGDIAQLSFDGVTYGHTLVIINILDERTLDKILIATHTDDSYNRRISSYNFMKIRFIKIENIRYM